MIMRNLLVGTLCLLAINTEAQDWQQHVSYTMEIDFDVETNQFDGVQTLDYTNNSPDTLRQVFYHLYFNAFQPGSMMDERSRSIQDPDGRVKDRIYHLKEDEIGYHNILSFDQAGKPLEYRITGTILQAKLEEPIAPGETVQFNMEFHSQVPKQIRRSGRDNKEGIEYTMTQWYPKMAEYDKDGWHPNQYIGREFYGVWGDFNVSISIDPRYVIGGTGVLLQEQGGAAMPTASNPNKKKVWNFYASDVHDFAWAADPDYQHDVVTVPGITELHFYYQTDTLAEQWVEVQDYVVQLFQIMSEKFGKYPYAQFSVIQGGDGGMEYPMCTMILGHGDLKGKVGLIAHEAFHNWYYGILGSNEFRYPWMDEGFTSYAEYIVLDSIYHDYDVNPLTKTYQGYAYYAMQDWQEPLSTPADFFHTNASYGLNSYYKGSVFVHQLSYVIGQDALDRTMLRYFDEFKFKHPDPYDFIRIAERESGMHLDWYLEHWMYTLNQVDYSVELESNKKATTVNLERIGDMPMPIDLTVTYKDGSVEYYHIPLRMTYGSKVEGESVKVLGEWPWTNETYSFTINQKMKSIVKVEIDPSLRLADVDRTNNEWPRQKEK